MRFFHCTWALVACLGAAAQAQTPPATTGYALFVRGAPAGREDITVQSDGSGTTISSQGRTSTSGDGVLRHVEIRYDAAGAPSRFELEGTINGGDVTLRTTFAGGTAQTEGVQQGKPFTSARQVSPRAIIFANGSVAGFAALPPLLARLAAGDEFRVFILPTAEISARVVSATADRMQTGTSLFDVRRYELLLADPGGNLAVSVTTSTDGALLRVAVPAQGLEVLRADLASATSRTTVSSNPGDQAVIIPAPGFNLGATLTMPSAAASQTPADRTARPDAGPKPPAVVLISGSRAADRDALVPGVPTMAQLAGALADGGFVVVRYDRRGAGQSGGRAESATLTDYAEDARTIVRWLSARKDIDAKRIALVGHGEGAWEALLAASKEKRVAAVVTLEAGGTGGADLVLEQQQLQLERSSLSPADRDARVALQKRIHDAVLTGRGWAQLSPEIRKQADTPWFASLLAYDPAKVLQGVDVPLLIVHGDLDREIPVAHADRLAELARKGDAPSVAVTIVRGVNHVLLPAFTGDVSEYATLTDRRISKDTSEAVVTWLAKTLVPAAR